jgi:hypothetical protein
MYVVYLIASLKGMEREKAGKKEEKKKKKKKREERNDWKRERDKTIRAKELLQTLAISVEGYKQLTS